MFFPALGAFLTLLATTPTFSGSPSLVVQVKDPAGEPVAGASLQLCPLSEEMPPHTIVVPSRPEDCRGELADAAGQATFSDVPEGEYFLTATLDGFAGTALLPLPIGQLNPVAPDEVLVVMNPICFDCVGGFA